ncbi:MAG: adenylate/guanylate cyclase domain-containing protein [Candidatus Kapaibacterium sp.]
MTTEQLTAAVTHIEDVLRNGSDFALAETLALPLLDLPLTPESHALHVRILLVLSSSLWQRGSAERGVAYAERALVISQEHHFQELHAQALNACGSIQWQLSEYVQALGYYERALAIYRELNNQNGIAKSLGNCASAYLKLADYPAAAEYFHNALDVYQQLGDTAGIALALGNCGQVSMNLSDYAPALEYFHKALELYQALGHQDGIAANLAGCGIIYHQLSDFEKALEYYRKALDIYEVLGANDGIARNLCNCGNTYFALGELIPALEHYRKALEIAERIGRTDGIAINLGNCAIIYEAMGDYTAALEYLYKALALNETIGSRGSIAVNLGNIGAIYATTAFEGYDAAQAEEYLVRAIAISEEIGEKHNQIFYHQTLAEVYKSQERWKECLTHFESYTTLEKEVLSEAARKQAHKTEQRREAAEREKALEIERAAAASEKKILNNILPAEITVRLIEGENPIADHFESVSIMFMDVVGFTPLASRIPASELVHLLNTIFSVADKVIREFGLEKIKTIGDAYMAVCGAPVVQKDHAVRTAHAALKLLEIMENLPEFIRDNEGDAAAQAPSIPKLQVRIGLHCGEAVAGVVGENKFLYDLWGDAVNTASRMESHGEAGKIHVSDEFKHAVETLHATSMQATSMQATSLQFIRRGEMDIKGKGIMKTYFLEKK